MDDDTLDILNSVVPTPPQQDESALASQAPPRSDSISEALDSALDPHWQDKQLAASKQRLRSQGDDFVTESERFKERSVPFASAAYSVIKNKVYQNAMERYTKGEATGQDIDLIAQKHHEQEVEQGRGTWGKIGSAVANVPALAGESYVGGQALRGLGMVGQAAPLAGPFGTSPSAVAGAAGRYLGQQAAQTALSPSFYLPQASQRSLEQGGEVYSPQNILPAFGEGVIQNLVLGAAGNFTPGVKNPALRFVTNVGSGMAAMQGADTLASLADKVLPDAYQTKTRFGTIGQLINGEKGAGLQKAAVDAVTFGVFTLMHGNPDHGREVLIDFKNTVDEAAKKGLPVQKAAEAAQNVVEQAKQPEPGQMPAEAPAEPVEAPSKPLSPEVAGQLPGQKSTLQPDGSYAHTDPTNYIPPEGDVQGKPSLAERMRNKGKADVAAPKPFGQKDVQIPIPKIGETPFKGEGPAAYNEGALAQMLDLSELQREADPYGKWELPRGMDKISPVQLEAAMKEKGLDEREMKIVRGRFVEGKTFPDIAKSIINPSTGKPYQKQRIDQIWQKAMDKLKVPSEQAAVNEAHTDIEAMEERIKDGQQVSIGDTNRNPDTVLNEIWDLNTADGRIAAAIKELADKIEAEEKAGTLTKARNDYYEREAEKIRKDNGNAWYSRFKRKRQVERENEILGGFSPRSRKRSGKIVDSGEGAAPVRPAGPGGVQEREAATEGENDVRPPVGNTQGAPAPTEPETASNKLSFGQREARRRAEDEFRYTFQDADEHSIPRADLHDFVEREMDVKRGHAADRNELLKALKKAQGEFTGKQDIVKKYGDDPSQVPHWDEVIDQLGLDSDQAFEIWKEGKLRPKATGQDYGNALDSLIASKQAEAAEPPIHEVAPGVHFFKGQGAFSTGAGSSGTVAASVTIPPGTAASFGAGSLRHYNAERVRRMDVAATAVTKGEAFFNRYIDALNPKTDKPEIIRRFLDFFGNIEKKQPVPADQQEYAQTYKDLKGDYQKELFSRNIVDNAIEDHVQHMWIDPSNPNASPQQIAGMFRSRRPLAGKEGFTKARSLDYFEDGIAMGLEPVDWNPMTYAKKEFDSYSRSIFAYDFRKDATDNGMRKFVPLGKKAPPDWTRPQDKGDTVFAPPEKKGTEFFDKQQMEGLENFASSLGINVQTVMTGPPGRSDPQGIVRRFGTPEMVLAHEIGHQIDGRYQLGNRLLRAPGPIQTELRDLADLRASGQVSPVYQAYLRSQPEQIANLVAAYIHAPELLKQEAPIAAQWFDTFLAQDPQLAPLRDIKPSLELSERQQAERLAGPMLVGHYYYPQPITQLLDNHVMPGLASQPGAIGIGYRAFRGFGNQMTQFLLGTSGFHATGTALNAQFSNMAEALGMASRGDVNPANLLRAGVPLLGVADAVRKGAAIRAEWDKPGTGTPETIQMAKYMEEAGARARGGSEYVGGNLEATQKALRQISAGRYGKIPEALLRAIPALNQLTAKPTMDYLVPLTKMGVASDAMRYELSKNPQMSLNQRREIFGKIWDAMDDRFGLLTYDNMFMNRVVRDTMQAGFLSFGWNLGDVRGLGGGLTDTFKPSQWAGLSRGEGISRRTAFLLSIMGGAAMYGSLYQLAATGKGPDELKDVWFPKTGRKNKDGTDERISMPTYMKDITSVFNRAGDSPFQIPQNLWHMTKGKLNPAIKLVGEILDNQDWSGAAIIDPKDTAGQQAKDAALHVLSAFEPISEKQFRTSKDQSVGQRLQSFIGLTPAPQRITHTDKQLLQMEEARKHELSPLEKKRRQKR